jgi:hypothetical protein
VALLALPPVFMILGAIVRPAPPPDAKPALERLLRPGNAVANDQGKAAPASAVGLSRRYAELITPGPDLPPKLNAIRGELNMKYGRMLGKIAEYEKNNAGLSYAQAKERLASIDTLCQEIWEELNEATDNTLHGEGVQGLIIKRNTDYHKWRIAVECELLTRNRHWKEAGSVAQNLYRESWLEWEAASAGKHTDSRHPYFGSEYFRECGSQDWDRTVYYYWRAGGLDGYGHVAVLAYGRTLETARDKLGKMLLRIRS